MRGRHGPIACAVLALAAALAGRAFLPGLAAKIAGVALYATVVYALVVSVAPGVRVRRALAVTLAFCFAVELAQLTPGPAYLSARHVLFRLALGSTFSVWDLLMYVGGALLGAAVHAWAVPRSHIS